MTDEDKKVLGIATQNEMLAEVMLENIKQMLLQLSIEIQKVMDLLKKHRDNSG